tara:strand:+ start:1153 stop:1428 length:276 start_codon:yes stop_codon:yes gene_type:complete
MLRKKGDISGIRLLVGIIALVAFALLVMAAWKMLFKKEVDTTTGLIDNSIDDDLDGIPNIVDRCDCDASNPEPPEPCGVSDCSGDPDEVVV